MLQYWNFISPIISGFLVCLWWAGWFYIMKKFNKK